MQLTINNNQLHLLHSNNGKHILMNKRCKQFILDIFSLVPDFLALSQFWLKAIVPMTCGCLPATLKVISALTKVILATEELITPTLKVICAITSVLGRYKINLDHRWSHHSHHKTDRGLKQTVLVHRRRDHSHFKKLSPPLQTWTCRLKK